jgi:hypothetical protein
LTSGLTQSRRPVIVSYGRDSCEDRYNPISEATVFRSMTARFSQDGAQDFGSFPKSGRVCSLHFRPRRWFGCRIERILGDFLQTDDVRLSGLREATLDVLSGTVRRQGDDRVLLSAHHTPEAGTVRVEVTVFYSVPTEDLEHAQAIIDWLGRTNRNHSYYRLGGNGTLPVQAEIRLTTGRLRAEHGETFLVTSYSLKAKIRTPRENRGGNAGRSARSLSS